MKTTPLTNEDIASSVIAVPPLARRADLTIDPAQNAALVRHIQKGRVKTLLYGGNANLYNVALSEYAGLLDMLVEIAASDTLVIPSVGPAYGTMMDQAEVLRDFDFPTVMVLPPHFASTPDGVQRGVHDVSEVLGKPIVLYIKQEGLIRPEQVRELVDDGRVSAIKYAVVRDDPAQDALLDDLVDAVDPRMIISGIGEQPAIVHLRKFGLGGFTSGCVCIAPHLSAEMLMAIKDGKFDRAEDIRAMFEPLENLRNAISPIRVLHDAVTLSGIAGMGPVLPLLSGLDDRQRPEVARAARALLDVVSRA